MSNLKNINEVVFADKSKINDKKKTIGITYSTDKRANNNANVFDKLGTEEMKTFQYTYGTEKEGDKFF